MNKIIFSKNNKNCRILKFNINNNKSKFNK